MDFAIGLLAGVGVYWFVSGVWHVSSNEFAALRDDVASLHSKLSSFVKEHTLKNLELHVSLNKLRSDLSLHHFVQNLPNLKEASNTVSGASEEPSEEKTAS